MPEVADLKVSKNLNRLFGNKKAKEIFVKVSKQLHGPDVAGKVLAWAEKEILKTHPKIHHPAKKESEGSAHTTYRCEIPENLLHKRTTNLQLMENRIFWIELDQDGHKNRMKVIAEENELDSVFKVEFPDHNERRFYTFEVDNETAWAEMDKGVTDLSVKVGEAIDKYLDRAG